MGNCATEIQFFLFDKLQINANFIKLNKGRKKYNKMQQISKGESISKSFVNSHFILKKSCFNDSYLLQIYMYVFRCIESDIWNHDNNISSILTFSHSGIFKLIFSHCEHKHVIACFLFKSIFLDHRFKKLIEIINC